MHGTRRVVLTGGPRAGKTAALIDMRMAEVWADHPRV